MLFIYFYCFRKKRDILLHFVEHPFLNVTHGTPSIVTVEEGKRCDFQPQVNALPAPDKIMW